MKYPFAIAATALLTAPALAQTAQENAAFEAEIERQEELDEAVLAVDRLVEAVLDMPVGPLADALPGETLGGAPVRQGDTVRDLGSRDDPAFEENVRGGARAMTAVIGDMMQKFTARMPELEGWMAEAE